MPYTDGQELTNAAGDVARYSAADNKWTVIPKSSQPGATPKPGQAIPAREDETSTPTDLGRGVYHGGTNFVAGTMGFPGDVGNKLTQGYDWATGSHHGQPLAGTSDYKEIFDKAAAGFAGGPIEQPKGVIGNFAKTATEYAPATVMGRMYGPPGQSWLKSALSNTVGPVAGAELMGAATDDDPRARFVGAMLGGRSLNPIGGRKAIMADKLEGLSKTYQARENAFRADQIVSKDLKEHYAKLPASGPEGQSAWLTRNYQGVQPKLADESYTAGLARNLPGVKNFVPPPTNQKVTWGEFNKENKIAHEIHDSHPIADNALPLAGALTAGVFGHRHGLTPEIVGGMMGGVGLTGYLGVRGLGQHLPIPKEETVAALLGNNPTKSAVNSVLFSNPMRAEKDQ